MLFSSFVYFNIDQIIILYKNSFYSNRNKYNFPFLFLHGKLLKHYKRFSWLKERKGKKSNLYIVIVYLIGKHFRQQDWNNRREKKNVAIYLETLSQKCVEIEIPFNVGKNLVDAEEWQTCFAAYSILSRRENCFEGIQSGDKLSCRRRGAFDGVEVWFF